MKNIHEEFAQKIVGFRNIVIHGYFGVDLNIVWTVVRKHLKELKPKIESVLREVEH